MALESEGMELGIKGRVAMVAAASKGIGKAIALGLAQEACRVSICGRTKDSLESSAREIESTGAEVLAIQADVSRLDDLNGWHSRTVERFGRVDILVTNTGGPAGAPFLDLTDEPV